MSTRQMQSQAGSGEGGRASRRFAADWIEDMDEDEGPTKQGKSYHQTFEAAHIAAVKSSKKADVIEWIKVREQVLNTETLIWETVRTWTGDYEVIEEREP